MFDLRGPDAAIVDPHNGQTLTCLEVSLRAEALVPHLVRRQKGLTFLFCDNSLHAVLFYLAALNSDNATALLDSAAADVQKDNLVSCYKPETIVVCGSDWVPDGTEYSQIVQEPDYSVWCSLAFGQPPHKDLCLLLSTSGSTGSAKMVRLSRRNLLSNAQGISRALSIDASERAVLSLPIHYSYGLSVLNTHLLTGASLMLTTEALTSSGFWSQFRENRCTSFAGVPYSYEILRRLGLDNLNLDSLKTMTQAGGKLSDKLIDYFQRLMSACGGRFFVMYGQTEATARISVLPAEELPDRLGSVGKALDGGTISIEGAGEIIYRGPNVMLGYATERADLARGDDLEGRLETGDLGYLDDEGFLYVTGRSKRIAKIFGQRLNLDDVERVLKDCGPMAAVSDDQKLCVYFENLNDDEMAIKRSELSSLLHIHHSAIATRTIAEIPRTANGKVDYASLEKQI